MLELATKQLVVSTTLGWEDGSVSDVVALHGMRPEYPEQVKKPRVLVKLKTRSAVLW